MRNLTPVTSADLASLACPYCGTAVSEDEEWVGSSIQIWGLCGWRVPGAQGTDALILLTPSIEPTSALIKRLWVAPGATGRGLGKRLIQSSAANLSRSSITAILSRGSRTHVSCASPPRDFLREVGFTRQLDERLYRLDLNRAVSTRNPLQTLLDRVAQVLQPGPGEPAAGGLSPRAMRRGE